MLAIVIEVVWFFLPAIVANSMPVVASKYQWIPAFAVPLDSGLVVGGQRLLGDHKTLRGVLVAVIFGSIAGYLQSVAFRWEWAQFISLFPYTLALSSIFLGGCLALGALAGDAVKSFVKRRLSLAPGVAWPLFDQIDFVIGALLVGSLFVSFSLAHVIVALVVLGFGSFITSVVGVKMKIKKSL